MVFSGKKVWGSSLYAPAQIGLNSGMYKLSFAAAFPSPHPENAEGTLQVSEENSPSAFVYVLRIVGLSNAGTG